ncbi:hypothetical protein [Pontibacter saemangeumensis]|uniref:hypothetical protein n=1 Tax=Pontibacter saemangeumensis TaxID=1084525 RepID=UPI0031E9814B
MKSLSSLGGCVRKTGETRSEAISCSPTESINTCSVDAVAVSVSSSEDGVEVQEKHSSKPAMA